MYSMKSKKYHSIIHLLPLRRDYYSVDALRGNYFNGDILGIISVLFGFLVGFFSNIDNSSLSNSSLSFSFSKL